MIAVLDKSALTTGPQCLCLENGGSGLRSPCTAGHTELTASSKMSPVQQHPASSSCLGGLGARRRRSGRDRRVAPPPDGPSALGAGMRQSRDLTSGAGVLSSRGAPRVPAGPPRSVTGRRGRGEGVRFVADGGRPLRRADRPSSPVGLPSRAPLFSPCPAARRRRRRRRQRSADAPAPGAARAPPRRLCSHSPSRDARRRTLEPERPAAAGAGRG